MWANTWIAGYLRLALQLHALRRRNAQLERGLVEQARRADRLESALVDSEVNLCEQQLRADTLAEVVRSMRSHPSRGGES